MASKRIFDVFFAVVFLFLCMPIFTMVAVAIKVNSPGSIFFTQRRVGYRGSHFTIFKFRSMIEGQERPHEVTRRGDTRITFIGKVLRKIHLDELPQLWNIVRGDMSFVGPRPLPVELFESYVRKVPEYERLLTVRPGLSGLTQIRGREKLLQRSLRSQVLLNDYYVSRWSLCLDCKILLRTLSVIVRCRGI